MLESGLTINNDPPLDTPEITSNALPPERTYPFMAGLGPIYAISISSENIASIIEGPCIKKSRLYFDLRSRYFSKVPMFSPITACAWLIFGKYPTRIAALLPLREQALPVTIAKNRRQKTTRYRKIFTLFYNHQ